MAKKCKIPFYETSAKNNTNVANIFYEISKKIYQVQMEKDAQSKSSNSGFSVNSKGNTSVLASLNYPFTNSEENKNTCCM